ncbi:MAG TPA: dihydrofolate reductase family protein [Gemmatimonadaceae bacterium]|jgi:dihydrofolate reductase
MSKLRFRISISLDGYVAGPNQSVKEPLGAGGGRLHEWVTALEVWGREHNMTGGDVNESTAVVEEELVNVGATIMGRDMFGGGPGPWPKTDPWNGWWGPKPPFRHSVFVLTHHVREPLVMEGGTTFTFVTGGFESALEQARRAAGGKDVVLSGGARAAQQYLNAGLVDEMHLHVVPTLLGGGERLFDGVTDLHGLALVRTIAPKDVTHLKFARK